MQLLNTKKRLPKHMRGILAPGETSDITPTLNLLFPPDSQTPHPAHLTNGITPILDSILSGENPAPANPPNHLCSPADDQPLDPAVRYYGQHRDRGTSPCGWSRACASLQRWHRRNPDLPLTDYPGYRPLPPEGQLTHECAEYGERPLEATTRHYASHQRRGNPACEWARACLSLNNWLRKHPDKSEADYPGWRHNQDPDRPYKHTCGAADIQPAEPNGRYLDEHRYRNTEPCLWSRACGAFRQWQLRHPHAPLSEWPGYIPAEDRKDPNRPYLHDCGDADGRPIEAVERYYSEHRHRGTPACGWSRACAALDQWLRTHPELTADDYPGYTPLDDLQAQANHRCSDAAAQPVEPTNAYTGQHARWGTPPCGWAKACASFYRWHTEHPDLPLDGWTGYISSEDRHNSAVHHCSSIDAQPAEPTNAYTAQHTRWDTEPCEWSRACRAFYHWRRNHPDLPLDQWPGYTPRTPAAD